MACYNFCNGSNFGGSVYISGTTCLGVVGAFYLLVGQCLCIDTDLPYITCDNPIISGSCANPTPTPSVTPTITPTPSITRTLTPTVTSTPTATLTGSCRNYSATKLSTFLTVSDITYNNCYGVPQTETLEEPSITYPSEVSFCAIAGSLVYVPTEISVVDNGPCVIPTQTPTPTSSTTPTITPTSTPPTTPTNTATNTNTPTPTKTPNTTPPVTPTTTNTQTPTTTGTPPVTPTNTQTQTLTPTASVTPPVTSTPTPSITASPTRTQTPTPSTPTFCNYVTVSSLNSLDISITDVQVSGVSVTYISGNNFVINAGEASGDFGSNISGSSVTLRVYYNSSITGQNITVQDCDEIIHCCDTNTGTGIYCEFTINLSCGCAWTITASDGACF